MLLLRLWNFLRGYVIILVEGYFTERFINICTRRQLLLWDVKHLDAQSVSLKMSIKGFKMVRPVAKKTRSRVRIISKKGMPFILNRYKKRKAFVVGALLFLLLINFLASFIWDIEVTGNKEVGRSRVVEELFNLGIKPGTLKYKVDVDKIANELMLKVDELAWVGFEIKGTRVVVSIKERRQPPELIPKDIPCHIVAAMDGVISSIVVKAGQELVKSGDTVTKGQILVTGIIKNVHEDASKKEDEAQNKPRLVHALAEIEARTWYEINSTVKFKALEAIRTGEVIDDYRIVLWNKEFTIPFQKKVKFKNFDKVELRKRLTIGKDFVLPFELLTDKYFENQLVERNLSLEQAKEMAYNDALKKLMIIIPEDVKIINETIDYKQNDEESITINIILECVQDIGITKEIGGT